MNKDHLKTTKILNCHCFNNFHCDKKWQSQYFIKRSNINMLPWLLKDRDTVNCELQSNTLCNNGKFDLTKII